MGWSYARTGRYSFIVDGVGSFIRNNSRFFDQADDAEKLSDPAVDPDDKRRS